MSKGSISKKEKIRKKKKVLRRIFRPKRKEVAGGWTRLHNEGLNACYSSQNIIKVIKSRNVSWADHVARKGEMGNAYKILAIIPEGNRAVIAHSV
jgi:hypothetical protein